LLDIHESFRQLLEMSPRPNAGVAKRHSHPQSNGFCGGCKRILLFFDKNYRVLSKPVKNKWFLVIPILSNPVELCPDPQNNVEQTQ
jgi:hypothetical protein